MPQRHSLVFILPSFTGGGAERVTLNLIRLADRVRFRISLIVLDPSGPLASAVPGDVSVIALNTPQLRDALARLARELRSLRPAVVFSTFTHINLSLLALKPFLSGIAFLVREANLPSANIPRMPWPWGFRQGYRWLYANASIVIASSVAMKTELSALGVRQSSIEVLRNPVDEAALRSKAVPVARHPGEGARFIAVGRLQPQKGFDRLLNLMAEMPDQFHCTILGDGPERSALEQQVSQLQLERRVSLPGFVANPAPWIAGADALLMSSRFEGMPNAALEALALGTPVIATPEAGGIGEIDRVTIARMGPEFADAMRHAPIKREALSPAILPPSMLPEEFRLANVGTRFNELIERAASRLGSRGETMTGWPTPPN